MVAFCMQRKNSFCYKHSGGVRYAPLWNFPKKFAGNTQEANGHVSSRVADHERPLASNAQIGMNRKYRTNVRLKCAVSGSNINLAQSEIAGDSSRLCVQALGQ